MKYPIYKLVCLTPQIAFNSLILEKPKKLIFTSGTLPESEIIS
jgi:hypothetical protein